MGKQLPFKAPSYDSRAPSCKLCRPAHLHIRRLGRFSGGGGRGFLFLAEMFYIGIRIGDMDLMIAATAIYNDLTLVTNNTKHFENMPNLKLENWKN